MKRIYPARETRLLPVEVRFGTDRLRFRTTAQEPVVASNQTITLETNETVFCLKIAGSYLVALVKNLSGGSGKLIYFNLSDITVSARVTFADDGRHENPCDVAFDSAYAYTIFAGTDRLLVTRSTLGSTTYTDLINDTGRVAGIGDEGQDMVGPAIECKGDNLYTIINGVDFDSGTCSAVKYSTAGAFVDEASLEVDPTPGTAKWRMGMCIQKDPADNQLWVSGWGAAVPSWYGKLDDDLTFEIVAFGSPPLESSFTDPRKRQTFVGDYAFFAVNHPDGYIVKAGKDLATETFFNPPVLGTKIEDIWYDGTYLNLVYPTFPSYIKRVNPTTGAVVDTISLSVNEATQIVGNASAKYISTRQTTSQVVKLVS